MRSADPTADSAGRMSPAAIGKLIGLDGRAVIRYCQRDLIEGAVQLPNGRWRVPVAAVEHLIPGTHPSNAT